MGIVAAQQLAPVAVLAELSACDHAERAAAARRLELAVAWAELHPGIADQPYDKVVDSLIDETTQVSVAAIAEFAAVHGIPTNTGRQLIADAVALHDRLPRCWQQMLALALPAWKGRLLAQAAHGLGQDAVAWLDTRAALLGAKLGVRTIKRLALLARAQFEPETLTDPSQRRWVRVSPDPDDSDAAAWLEGRLDTPDALDLDAALRLIAADLAADGVETDLDARRAQALGVMARRALGQRDLPAGTAAVADHDGTGQDENSHDPAHPDTPDADTPPGTDPAEESGPECGVNDTKDTAGNHAASERGHERRADRTEPVASSADTTNRDTTGERGHEGAAGSTNATASPSDPDPTAHPVPAAHHRARSGRPVMIYLHFDATQLTNNCSGLGELGTTGQLVTIDQIRTWCSTAGTITIRPVIDLNHSRATRSYQPTEVMREHLALRDRTCVFPHCTRVAHPVRRRSTGAVRA